MVKPLALIPPVLFAGIAGLFAAGMFLDSNGEELPSALIGQPVPQMDLEDFAGKAPITAEVLADGEVKLVNFWASWCGPCRVEHPHLAALAEAGVPIYGINYDDTPENAQAFLDEQGDFYTGVSADPERRNARDWGVYGVPETFVVDGDGMILMRIAGPVTEYTVENRLRPLLEQAAE